MKALYCTADTIGLSSGGGVVTFNESEALKRLTTELTVIDQKVLQPYQDAMRGCWTPFLEDYFTLCLIKGGAFDLAHFYSGCFSNTISYLKARGTRVTITCPAHDRAVTMEEHRLQGLSYPYPHISDDRLWAHFIGGVLLADLVIAPSKLAASFLATQGCKNIVVIPHGCTLPDATAGFPPKFQVGYLGQIGPDKGVGYLIAAWAKLNYPDATLVLAGPGTEQLGNYISRNVNGGKYHLAGFVSNASDFFNSISVLVQPSVCEAFGITVLEAMAHGRPVVASEGAGASELIENGKTGFVVPIRSPDAIAEKLQWCKRNPQKVAEMGTAAREKAQEFTWEKMKGRYLEQWKPISSPSSPA